MERSTVQSCLAAPFYSLKHRQLADQIEPFALRLICTQVLHYDLGSGLPSKRLGSDNWHFRTRIPADVEAILAEVSTTPELVHCISISLRTADRAAAKARCPEIAAEVERALAALRAGRKPLTLKQINALSGELDKR
jgi:uncharacterized protein DUF6538